MHGEGSCNRAQIVCRYRLLCAVYVLFSSPVFLHKGRCVHVCVMPLSRERRTGREREREGEGSAGGGGLWWATGALRRGVRGWPLTGNIRGGGLARSRKQVGKEREHHRHQSHQDTHTHTRVPAHRQKAPWPGPCTARVATVPPSLNMNSSPILSAIC